MSTRILAVLLLAALLAGRAAAQSYSYDPAGRLTLVTYSDGTTIAYTYDAAGNVTSTNVTSSPPFEGCFIATAAYGSPLDPHVQTLRDFREAHLLTNAPGRAFCAWYAEVSPPIAAFLVEHPALKPPVRAVLAPVVYSVAYPRTALAVSLAVVFAARSWWKRRRARLRTVAV